MNSIESDIIIRALTRSGMRRDKLGIRGSDELLLRRLEGSDGNPEKRRCLAFVSKMLRLMDALIRGVETGEGFLEKFSGLWQLLRAAHEKDLGTQAEKLQQFYYDIQFFCASQSHQLEEPSLFGSERLKALTEVFYIELENWWRNQLTISEVARMK